MGSPLVSKKLVKAVEGFAADPNVDTLQALLEAPGSTGLVVINRRTRKIDIQATVGGDFCLYARYTRTGATNLQVGNRFGKNGIVCKAKDLLPQPERVPRNLLTGEEVEPGNMWCHVYNAENGAAAEAIAYGVANGLILPQSVEAWQLVNEIVSDNIATSLLPTGVGNWTLGDVWCTYLEDTDDSPESLKMHIFLKTGELPSQATPRQDAQGQNSITVGTARKLLHAAFTPKEFWRLIQETRHPRLRPLINEISYTDSISTMADKAIEFVMERDIATLLLTEVKRVRPRQYARFVRD